MAEKKDIDLNNVINDMEREDEPVEERVDLFDNFSPETPFTNTPEKKNAKSDTKKNYNNYGAKSEVTTTIIGSSTVIQGDIIITEADLEFHGKVTGNINISGDLTLLSNAIVEGDINANSIDSEGDISITGNIKVKNEARIEYGTMVSGNITAKSLEIGGAIKGNSEIASDIYAKDTAVFDGNIQAGSLKMEPGSQLCGQVQIKH